MDKKTVYGVLGLFFLLAGITNLFSPNFGFSDFGGSEAVGFNLWILFVYVAGPFLLYKGLKKNKNVADVKKQSIIQSFIYCSKCGTKNDKDAKFCTKCGLSLIQ